MASKSWYESSSFGEAPLAAASSFKQHVSQWCHSKRFFRLCAASAVFITIALLYLNTITDLSTMIPSTIPLSPTTSTTTSSSSSSSSSSSPGPKHAFATLLGPNYKPNVDQSDIAADDYFLSARVLNYQLQHSNLTRYTLSPAPFLVLCPPGVAQNKRDILASEGATIVPVPHITAPWIHAPLPTWVEMLDKLLLWSYTDYDRILYLDADVYLITSLDGIFADAAAADFPVDEEKKDPRDAGRPPMPSQYSLAGVVDGGSGSRANPMDGNYMNAGFFLLRPDAQIFQHLMWFVDAPDSFSVSMMEQNLINDVFRQQGPMPWQRMDPRWDTSCPEPDDVEDGYRTIHSKLWKLKAEPCDIDPVVGRMWYKTLGHMEAHYAQVPLR